MAVEFTYPAQVISVGDPSVGLTGQPVPGSANQIGGNDAGNLIAISVDSSGYVNTNVISSGLPTGAATSANQTTEITQLTDINANTSHLPSALGQALMAASLPVTIASNQSILDVTVATSLPAGANSLGLVGLNAGTNAIGTVSLNASLPTGTNTIGAVTQASGPWTQNLTEVSGATLALGQALITASLPVTLASNQPDINVTVATALPVGTNSIGTVGLNAGTNSIGTVGLNAGTSAIGTVAINAAIPAGTNTIGAVTQASGPWTQNLTEVGGVAIALGQTLAASSLPVVLASNVELPSSLGRSSANAPVYNSYGTTPVSTTAYTQLVASTTSITNYLDIFDSSGQAMILATGIAGSEVVLAYIPPGGDQIPVTIPAGTRIAYKALTATAASGFLLMNFWS